MGGGDEVMIDMWGRKEGRMGDNVCGEGSMRMGDLGLIYVKGMSIGEGKEYLGKEVNKIYGGVDNEEKGW